jgi:HAD superfamily hydrolase (TIGR01509 family)
MRTDETLQAVVFDLDGLMFNTEELYRDVGHLLVSRRGHEAPPELFDAMMGRPGNVSLKIMIEWYGFSDTIEELTTESGDIFSELLNNRLEPMPGTLVLLDALEKARVPKAIATSSGREFVLDVLSRFEFEPRFDFLLTAEDVTQGKPFPEVYQTAARRLGVAPGSMMVLEDSQAGLRAAVEAGAYAVAVPSPFSSHHDFSGAAMVVDSLEDPRIYQALGLPATGASSDQG